MITYTFDPKESPEWGGRFCPVIICDACAQQITDSGNVYWVALDFTSDHVQVHPEVWHTHKWPCSRLDDAIKAQHPNGIVLSEELDVWLRQLRHNFTHQSDNPPDTATNHAGLDQAKALLRPPPTNGLENQESPA